MSVFDVISLLGGLALFLYGMRLMGDGLKESSSGPLKKAMEQLTNTPIKAFLLGLLITAVIQSSTATIVITSGLVGAGIISLHQSLGIVIGANVGTTVTGQIIRLLDLDASGTQFLQFFQPSTLAPLALIVGIILIMGPKTKNSAKVGQIVIGFGILFTGLLSMTSAVNDLKESGLIEGLFSRLGENPLVGYLMGAGIAFALQSSSATIGILQAFSTSGQLTFSAIYAVLVGIYLGDCVTTAIVCNIGAKPDAKRVGLVNILFNLSETVVILIGVTVVHKLGLLDSIWHATIHSGGIANTNTVFNLSCAILLFPMLGIYEKLSHRLVKDEKLPQKSGNEKLDALSPVFFSTPPLALGRCHEALLEMLHMARENLNRGFRVVERYQREVVEDIESCESQMDRMADEITNYLVQLSPHITAPYQVEIMNHYYSVVSEVERIGDHTAKLGECAQALHDRDADFTQEALGELAVLRELLDRILDYTEDTFRKRDIEAARHIEPLEEVVDDMVNALKDNHLDRLREGKCSIFTGTEFLNLLSDVERISDCCSNIGVATIVRAKPELKHQVHEYVSRLHAGGDEEYNRAYQEAHQRYFRLLKTQQGQMEEVSNP
jgi:phosphate:Na+ symporter